jgi:hypothetical protein
MFPKGTPEARDYRWLIAASAVQFVFLAGYLNGVVVLLFPVVVLLGLGFVVVALSVCVKRPGFAGALIGISISGLGLMSAYGAYVSWAVRARLGEYQAALPEVLAAERAHCARPSASSTGLLPDSCDLQDHLPPWFDSMAQRVLSQREGDELTVFFVLRGGPRWLLIYAPARPAVDSSPWHSLGNGWFTTVPQRRSRAAAKQQ